MRCRQCWPRSLSNPSTATGASSGVQARPFPVGVMTPSPFGSMVWLAGHTVALVLAYITWGVLHYSCWQALPERYRATTPARAVGFLFIPFFNFYWAFVSLPKLAEGFNALDFEHPDLHMKDARGLGVLKAIFFVAYWTFASASRFRRCCVPGGRNRVRALLLQDRARRRSADSTGPSQHSRRRTRQPAARGKRGAPKTAAPPWSSGQRTANRPPTFRRFAAKCLRFISWPHRTASRSTTRSMRLVYRPRREDARCVVRVPSGSRGATG